MFKIEEWLIQQDQVQLFTVDYQGEKIEAKILALTETQVAVLEQITDRVEAIKYASNYGLVVRGERYAEQGSLENLENLWKLSRLPSDFRENLADQVCHISHTDLPEAAPLDDDELVDDYEDEPAVV